MDARAAIEAIDDLPKKISLLLLKLQYDHDLQLRREPVGQAMESIGRILGILFDDEKDRLYAEMSRARHEGGNVIEADFTRFLSKRGA